MVRSLLTVKIAKILINDKGWVIGGTNYDFLGPRWVSKLYNKFVSVRLFVYLSVRPIITHVPLYRFASNWGTRPTQTLT